MALVEIKQEDVSEEILEEFGLSEKTFERKYEVEGYISKPNLGRSSSDRQFYFINCRPCDPVKVCYLCKVTIIILGLFQAMKLKNLLLSD